MFQTPSRLSLALLASLLISGCQVDSKTQDALEKLRANLQSVDSGDSETLIPVPLPSGAPGIGSSCYVDRFQQPAQNISRSVDILFVADTSGSMRDNRKKVADGIFSLIEELPANADYRVGVMLAHGSTSPNSGLLWRLPQSQSNVPGNPYVLDSQQLSANNLRGHLRALMEAARDHGQEQGEMGLYSFMQSLTPSKFQENQARGFYRPEAALAVVFVSDENDICAVYPQSAHGTPGLTQIESQIRARDCSSGISATSVVEAARQAKGSQAVTFGAIIHNENDEDDEDDHEGFGWGYAQVAEVSRGVTIDIEECDYEDGLELIGQLVSQRLDLITARQLQHSPVDATSIGIWVDNVGQTGRFAPATNTVHLDYAGSAGSWVEIGYCTGGGSTGGGTGPVDPGVGV